MEAHKQFIYWHQKNYNNIILIIIIYLLIHAHNNDLFIYLQEYNLFI